MLYALGDPSESEGEPRTFAKVLNEMLALGYATARQIVQVLRETRHIRAAFVLLMRNREDRELSRLFSHASKVRTARTGAGPLAVELVRHRPWWSALQAVNEPTIMV